MDLFDRFNQKFGDWYENLFGGHGRQELSPKRGLAKIIEAMENGLSEGIDERVYAPNRYALEISIEDPDEREYLVSFLDEEELQAVLVRYMSDRGYDTLGPLSLTIRETQSPDNEKLLVRAWFERGAPGSDMERHEQAVVARTYVPTPEDEMTVFAAPAQDADNNVTVAAVAPAWAQLTVRTVDGQVSEVTIHKPVFTVGRSKNMGNDVVLSGDDQVSKRHLRIEREPDGGVTLYDLASTNGTYVRGMLVFANATILDGDQIEVGRSKITFRTLTGRDGNAAETRPKAKAARLIDDHDAEHILASETQFGHAVTSDIVLDHPADTRQARIFSQDGKAFFLEDLAADGSTMLNGRPVMPTMRIRLRSADVLELGGTKFVYKDAD